MYAKACEYVHQVLCMVEMQKHMGRDRQVAGNYEVNMAIIHQGCVIVMPDIIAPKLILLVYYTYCIN